MICRQSTQRRPARLFALVLDAVPKLAPDPVAAPVANGVAKEDTPTVGVEPNNGAVLVKEGAEVENELKSDTCGEVTDDANKDTGADVTGVENREDDSVEAEGVLKSEDPLPDGAYETAVDV